MGANQVKSSDNADAAAQISEQIDRRLESEKKLAAKTIKLLMLGPCNSGKSTIVKQMRILNNQRFSTDELDLIRSIVYSNTVTSMAAIINNMSSCGIAYECPDREIDAKLVMKTVTCRVDQERFSEELLEALHALWADQSIQKWLTTNVAQSNLPDCAVHFLSSLDRIASTEYKPNNLDVLFARSPTSGVVELRFELNKLIFRVVDVGGQKAQRRKWMHCFQDVSTILFVVAMSDYDLSLPEDASTNRIHDALQLFEWTCNNEWLVNASMILFLNKKDLFEEKLKTNPISIAFPQYTGGLNYEKCSKYLAECFGKRRASASKDIYTHFTCATDTNQIQLVLDACIDKITSQHLAHWGLA